VLWWLASVGLFVGLWELGAAVGWINAIILPPPHATIGEIQNQPDFLRPVIGVFRIGANFVALTAIVATLERVLVGLILAFLGGLIVGGLAFSFATFGKLVLPLITVLSPVAPIAWLPLALVAFGVGDPAAIFVVFVALFFILTIGVVNTMQGVSQVYVNTARVLGATRWKLMLHVILPATLPGLFMITRMNFFGAWTAVLAAEVVGVNTGLGAIIWAGRMTTNMRLMFLGLALIGLIAFLLDQLFGQIQNRVLWWKSNATV
jgi:NitT/TauT family transport system permease protein